MKRLIFWGYTKFRTVLFRNLTKLGLKKTNNRLKINRLECCVSMDNDYRMKHNHLFHPEMLKQQKVVRWKNINAPKNPFKAALSCPRKVPCIYKGSLSTSHVVSASSVVDESSTTDAITTIIDRLSCNSTKIWEISTASSEKPWKQSSTIHKSLATYKM